MNEMCGDNRFEIIAKAKAHLLDATNIDTSPKEMEVLDDFLFRCWQMGWLDRYDRKDEPQTHEIRTNTHECVKDTHDKTEPQICDTCRYYNDYIPCGSTPSACKEADRFAKEFAVALMKLKPQTERGGE